MRFLHLHVHRARYRDAVIVRFEEGLLTCEPPTVDCPRCGWSYFADSGEELEPDEAEVLAFRATVRLDRECPDHAHAFVVGE